jgi:predicted small integral membrane protein
VKKWPWSKILVYAACLLLLACVAPWAYLFWWENTHNPEPLSVPLSLTRGEYTSPYFITDLDGAYQIDLDWNRSSHEQNQLDLDWKIVDDSGAVVQQGAYSGLIGYPATEVRLGEYSPRRGLRQRIILRIHEGVSELGAKSRLNIGQPEVGLDLAEGYIPLAIEWTGVIAGSGVIMLLVLLIWRVIQGNSTDGSSEPKPR